ncbi:MAG: hypothetical protein IJB35_00710, partial [Oscillospiraceae bacterium]|nr:hypothetical protein [Oscillospiraceae bacterium]
MSKLDRELFVGLGGTGGHALQLLYKQMTEEQRRSAKYVYIDTDQKDINKMEVAGIRTIPISNADTVRQVALSLGNDKDILDWLPREQKFLNSRFDDGASQCRMKSRLTLARFLKEGAPGLKEMLEEMTPPGSTTEKYRLRVVIVSSVAGGTGAGTFIQMALYIRKFFRMLNQKAEIIGILSCPDLYRNVVRNETERISMFANAYASIRELNAMNLATNSCDKIAKANDENASEALKGLNHLQGYGDNIKIKLHTKSEGILFDSEASEFKMDESAKPFDLIYFVDRANEKGGILRNVHEYYRVMADVAYTRLYSPMNGLIEGGESNELRIHTLVPTAIYGGAGYASVRYPYEAIVQYLAEKKLLSELDQRWKHLDSLWDAECEQEQDAASAYGGYWTPAPGQRGRKYRDDLDAELTDEKSGFSFLRDMIYSNGSDSRVEDFCTAIAEEASSLGGGSLPSDPEELKYAGGKFSILRDSAVRDALGNLISIAKGGANVDSEKPFDALLGLSAQVENNWGELEAAITTAVRTLSYKLSAAILPTTEAAIKSETRDSKVSLHYALLSLNAKSDVHPLAARYLL